LLSETAELADLLKAISGGERDAFKLLYDRTSSKLFGVVLRVVRDRGVAGEVLQDVYLRIWQNAASFDPHNGRPMTWMITIARNAAIDVIRRRTDVLLASGSEGEDRMQAIADPDDPERSVVMRDQLRRCLGELDDQQRDCVVLAYCSGYSRDELATHFGRPVATVKTWLHRSLVALRQCLGAP